MCVYSKNAQFHLRIKYLHCKCASNLKHLFQYSTWELEKHLKMAFVGQTVHPMIED